MPAFVSTLSIRGLTKKRMSELKQQAKHLGVTPEQFVKDLVEEKLSIAREARTKTFAEIIPPTNDIDEVELDRLVEESRMRFHRAEKR